MSVVTRFAPSPTGLLHIGNIRIALINFLYTQSTGGKFILRIDDTDKVRSTVIFEQKIKEDLQWLGLNWDDNFKQSERMGRYEEAKQLLIKSGRLYPCYETPEELALKRKSLLNRNLPPIYDRASLRLSQREREVLESQGINPHWRFLLQEGDIILNDMIRGEMQFDSTKLTDPILIKNDGTMTYTLASVVDDIDYGITDIIRGEDHLSNSATHIQIFKALQANDIPNFAHISLLYNKEQELSKRLGGNDVASLREKGIEPMAILSFLAKIGTSDSIEVSFEIENLISCFSFSKFNKARVHYDINELEILNKKLVHSMPYNMVKTRLDGYGANEEFWNKFKSNLNKVDDILYWWNVCNKDITPIILDKPLLREVVELLPKRDEWGEDVWSIWVKRIKEKFKGRKEIFAAIRLALTGLSEGPEMRILLPEIGYEKSVARLIQ